jgi:DNA-binding MarR family transcriptional regulator
MMPRVEAMCLAPGDAMSLLSPFPREALEFTTAVERAGRLILAARRGLGKAHGLSVAAWRLLEVVRRSHGRMSIAIAARRLGVSRQAVREAANALGARHLLAVVPDPANRKELLLLTTPKGGLARAELSEVMATFLLEMTNDLRREEMIAATGLLNRLAWRIRRCETVLRT